jgi:hypothetical protein
MPSNASWQRLSLKRSLRGRYFPFLAFGPTLMDVAFFLPSVAGDGGPSAIGGLLLYEQMSGYRFAPPDIAVMVESDRVSHDDQGKSSAAGSSESNTR